MAQVVQPSGLSRRTVTVWTVLLSAMTASAGAMLLLQQGQEVVGAGVSVTPLVAQGGIDAAEAALKARVPLDRERWQGITIHHSGSPYDTPERIEARHNAMNLRGLGHHFVIGNGRGMGDGELHVGYRWLDQLPGAHAVGPQAAWHNQHSISICLVGDGDRGSFTEAQMRRLVQLVAALSRELGLEPEDVRLHSEIAGVSSPGRMFPAATFRERLAALR